MDCIALDWGRANIATASYTGQLRLGEPHGVGCAIFPDGTKYIGEWKRSTQCGAGRLWLMGDTMTGTFVDGVFVEGRVRYLNLDDVSVGSLHSVARAEAIVHAFRKKIPGV